jgi:hypothetical protein
MSQNTTGAGRFTNAIGPMRWTPVQKDWRSGRPAYGADDPDAGDYGLSVMHRYEGTGATTYQTTDPGNDGWVIPNDDMPSMFAVNLP